MNKFKVGDIVTDRPEWCRGFSHYRVTKIYLDTMSCDLIVIKGASLKGASLGVSYKEARLEDFVLLHSKPTRTGHHLTSIFK